MPLPPERSTDRILLRPLSMAHAQGMFAMWSHDDVCRYSGEAQNWLGEQIILPARTRADSDQIIDFFVRRAEEGRGFRWAMIEKETGRFLGAIGFNHLTPNAEVAYHLSRAEWGQGYAREALEEALNWLVEYGSQRVEAWIDPANHRSISLVRRLGFTDSGESVDGATQFVRWLH